MKLILFLLLIFGSYLSSAQTLDQESIYFKVHEAAKKAKAGEKEGIIALYKMSLQDHGDVELNKMMIKTIMLNMIKNKSKALRKYVPAVDAKFIGRGVLDFLDQAPLQVTCPTCKGDGVEELKCRDSYDGVCKNCKGKGKIGYKGLGGEYVIKTCPICKGGGKCLKCEGTGIIKRTCRTCFGKGTVFSRAPVPKEYVKSLNHIVNFLPKYAARKKIYITPQIIVALERKELQRQLKEAEEVEKRQLAKQETERRAKEEEIASLKKKAPVIRRDTANYDSRLEHPLLEWSQKFRVSERISGVKLFESANAKYDQGKPTLTLDVTSSLLRLDAALKDQYLTAFYMFWRMRCKSNRVGTNVGCVITFKGKEVGALEVKGEEGLEEVIFVKKTS